MVYNEQKLEIFSRRAFKYEEKKIIDTHLAIREAIDTHFDRAAIQKQYGLGELPVLDIYLQGSYKNATNVTKSSDVDVVVQLQSIWRSNREVFTAEQLAKYDAAYANVSYTFQQFNASIQYALQQYFGASMVKNENKCLKIPEHGKYCNADVVSCFTYRYYGHFESVDKQSYKEGMYFITNDGRFIRNFPKLHYDALTIKSESTNGCFKETVRMFKNIRDDLSDRGIINTAIVPSYFLENLMYRVPVTYFSGAYTQRFNSILEHLIIMFNTGQMQRFVCANGVDQLFAAGNWNIEHAKLFLIELAKVRDADKF